MVNPHINKDKKPKARGIPRSQEELKLEPQSQSQSQPRPTEPREPMQVKTTQTRGPACQARPDVLTLGPNLGTTQTSEPRVFQVF
jgi:hypothetical protein